MMESTPDALKDLEAAPGVGKVFWKTMAKYWCGAAAIRLLWSFCLPLITAKRVAGVLAFFLQAEYLDGPHAVA